MSFRCVQVLALILVLTLSLVLVGCGGAGTTSKTIFITPVGDTPTSPGTAKAEPVTPASASFDAAGQN